MKIIPAIDLINGQCVRLSKGDYASKKVYNSNPLEVAKAFEDHGIQQLHLVDLDGAKAGKVINHKVLESICKASNLQVDFGGGLKTESDLQLALDAGAAQLNIGSLAVKDRPLFLSFLEKYGSDKIILGADCKHRMIATNGWTEGSDLEVIDYIQGYEKEGIKYVVCTDISKDGMLEGPAVKLYQEIMEKSKVKLIASGGVASMADLHELRTIGCEGVIVGKALYEGKISLKELSELC